MSKLLTDRRNAVTVLTLNRPEVHSQWGIRADRTAALATLGMPLADGLQLEIELCHDPALGPEAAAGMERFASGVRPEPPRAPVRA